MTDAALDTHADDELEGSRPTSWPTIGARRGDGRHGGAVARVGPDAAARALPLAAGAFALKGPGDAPALPLIALVCGGVAAALAPLANVGHAPRKARRSRCLGLDATRPPWCGPRAPQRRAFGRTSPPGWAGVCSIAIQRVAERIAAAEEWDAANSRFTSHSHKLRRGTKGAESGAWSLGAGSLAGELRTPATGVVLVFEAVRELQQRVDHPSGRPTICSPTGRPVGVKPAGTESAGAKVVLIQYAVRIHAT